MNSAGNALLNSTNTAVSSAVNNAFNGVQSSTGGYGMIFLGIGILLLIALGYMLYTQQTTISSLIPGLDSQPPRDWREMERRERREERREAREERREESAGFGENWCFVGEDVTGRWCVKVPRPGACTPERLFSSRPGCELVTASPLPLGLIANGGAQMKPTLAEMHTK